MIYVGKIVNTHGIKGEVRILSDIDHKNLVFKKGNKLKIDDSILTINTYRVHKNFDMVTFLGINDINDVLIYKNKNVYIDKNEITEDVLFTEDYIDLEVYSDRYIGKVSDILKNRSQSILVITNNQKKYLIPNVPAFIKEIDIENNKIIINEIEGLIDEN